MSNGLRLEVHSVAVTCYKFHQEYAVNLAWQIPQHSQCGGLLTGPFDSSYDIWKCNQSIKQAMFSSDMAKFDIDFVKRFDLTAVFCNSP